MRSHSSPVPLHTLGLVALLLSLSLSPSARADTVLPVWSLAPEQRPYITTGNTERGLAFDPVSRQVLLLSRAGGPQVYLLDPATGADGSDSTGAARSLSLLDAAGESPISGGTFTLNLVGAADDGAIFACNLATSLGSVKIYRWAKANPESPIAVAYAGDPLEGITNPGAGQDIRFGDAFAVRGSGPNTQLLQTARNGKYILLYTTTDGEVFTPRTFTAAPEIAGKIGLGLAFGEGQTIWAKVNGSGLLRIQLNTDTGRASLLNTVPTTLVPGNVTAIGIDTTTKRLASLDYSAHTLSVFDLTDPLGLIRLGDPLPFPAANANGNGTGAVAIRGLDVFGLDTNNGLLGARIEKSVVADPPSIATQPSGGSVYEGGSFAFSVAVQGTPPFTYQWSFEGNPIPNARGSELALTSVTPAQAGAYSVEVSNSAGRVTSSPASLTVRPTLTAGILKPLWALRPGDRPYLGTDNTQRGVAWNPITGNVLLATRSPANALLVLDPLTGAEKHSLRITNDQDAPIFSGGTLPLNMAGVADDGTVYAANLVTDGSTAAFRLYRWDNDSPGTVPVALPDVAELAVAERWGDTLDIRGKGNTTQILLGARGVSPQEGAKFAILGTTDGFNFTAQIYPVPGVASSAFGLGIAFGPGNTVFGTANGQPLVQATFNPASGTAELTRTYAASQIPNAASFIAFQPSSSLLAACLLETPDNVLLYDLTDLDNPQALDQQLILPEQPNLNGTGSIDFGANRLFVLDTNHGLRAYEIVRNSAPSAPTLSKPVLASGVFSFQLTGTAGKEYVVQRSSDLRTWTDLRTVTGTATLSDPNAPGAAAFYRALAR